MVQLKCLEPLSPTCTGGCAQDFLTLLGVVVLFFPSSAGFLGKPITPRKTCGCTSPFYQPPSRQSLLGTKQHPVFHPDKGPTGQCQSCRNGPKSRVDPGITETDDISCGPLGYLFHCWTLSHTWAVAAGWRRHSWSVFSHVAATEKGCTSV